jgi:serine/threonine protein kinase
VNDGDGSQHGSGDTYVPSGSLPLPVAGDLISGKYLVRGVLGSGGMGAVLEVEHIELGRRCALKILQADGRRDPTAVARFQNEARTVSALGHPNVCDVYDFGSLGDGRPYLVMPRLEGETLRQRLLGKRPSYPEAAIIITEVLDALDVVHARGIVHRDVKPANIFLARTERGRQTVKLLDFGVSKVFSGEVSLGLTGTGMVMGTPFYMAPEQARGEEELDGRVDLWACGVILYEMLSGERPFTGANYNQLMAAILDGTYVRLRTLRPDLPTELDSIVARAMAYDRRHRYATAHEFRDALVTSGVVPIRFDSLPASSPQSAPELVDQQNRSFRKLVSAFGAFTAGFDEAHEDGTITREEAAQLRQKLGDLEKWARHMQELLSRTEPGPATASPPSAAGDDAPPTTRGEDLAQAEDWNRTTQPGAPKRN